MKRFTTLVALLLLLVLMAPAAQAGARASVPADARGDELLVRLRSGTQLSGKGRASGVGADALNHALLGVRLARALPGADHVYQLRLAGGADLPALVARLSALPAVVYAEPNRVRTELRDSNDPMFARQTTLREIHAPEAWDISTGGAIPVAVLDTGVSPTHLDLKRKLLPGINMLDGSDNTRDDEGHGTHMAGIVAADSNNGLGVAGVCWGCTIIPVKVLDRRGRGDDATIASGIRWAVDHGARIISLSLGGPEDSRTLRESVDYARQHGVLLVAASGNGQARGNAPNFPAAYPGVLAVAASGDDDTPAPFSTSGDFVDIAAPGVGVLSTIWSRTGGDDYGVINGTSPAAPHVAGAAALVWTVRPDLTPDQVSEVLEMGADDIAAPGKDIETGYGRLNAARALQIASDPNLLKHSTIEGTIAGAPPDQVTVTLNDGRSARPDAAGYYRFDGLPPGVYTITATGPEGKALQKQASVSGTALSVARADLSFADAARFFQPVAPPSDPSVAFFPQTSHTLRGAFRAYWERNGGLPIFGYPISEEFSERGDDGREYLVQYFERHRFEYHPENAPPYDVLLARLGAVTLEQSGQNWFTFPKGQPREGCLFFAETGHSLCGAFLSYWRRNGLELDGRPGKTDAESLALFGQPLSEPRIEMLPDGRPHVVQWFERARFENHGEDGVLLGLLASDLAASRGWK